MPPEYEAVTYQKAWAPRGERKAEPRNQVYRIRKIDHGRGINKLVSQCGVTNVANRRCIAQRQKGSNGAFQLSHAGKDTTAKVHRHITAYHQQLV